MKKLLLLGLIASTTFVSAQVLQSENFNLLNPGNVGTSISGTVAGQGGFLTYADANSGTTTNAGNTNFKVASTISERENVFTLDGPNGNTGARYMWKDGLSTAWDGRTAGNDLIVATVEIKTSVRGASENSFGFTMYDADYRALVGFNVDSNTGELYLIAFSYDGAEYNNWAYPLPTEASPLGSFLPENTWTKIQIGFDFTTGDAFIAFSGNILGLTGAAAGQAPSEADFEVLSTGTNTEATTMSYDNLVIEAFSNALAVKKTDLTVGLNVYPNPTTDVVNVTLENKSINSVSISDLNGRIVKSKDYKNVSNVSMNVSDLATGVYMMSINSDSGTATKKIIKN